MVKITYKKVDLKSEKSILSFLLTKKEEDKKSIENWKSIKKRGQNKIKGRF